LLTCYSIIVFLDATYDDLIIQTINNFEYLYIDGIPISKWKGYELKQNYYWAMGDNRDDSLDSRYWGLIPEDFILGEALFAYFSLDLRTWLPRFDRIGTIIK
jgi:signal peptidase I